MSTPLVAGVSAAIALGALLLVGSTLLLTVSWIVARMLSRASSASRFVLWVSALTGIALIAAGRLLLPPAPLHTSASWSRALRLPAWASVGDTPTITATIDATDATASVVRVQTASSVAGAVASDVPVTAGPSGAVRGARSPNSAPWWALSLVSVWMAGALVVAVRFARGALLVRRFVRAAPRNLDGAHWTLLQQLCERMGVQRPVALRWVDAEQIPMTAGIVHPVVLLPRAAMHWPRERLQIVLQHELAHIARYDLAMVTIAQLVLVLCWWQPLAWYALRMMEREREQACDDLVLRAGVSASDYASELLHVVRELRVPAPSAFAALGMARASQVESRVRAVLNPQLPRRRASRVAVCAAGLMACAMLPIGRIVPVAQAARSSGSRSYSISRFSEAPTTSSAGAVTAGSKESSIFGTACRSVPKQTSVERVRDDSLDLYSRVDPRGCLRVFQRGRVRLSDDDGVQALEGQSARLIIEEFDGRTMRRLTADGSGTAPRISFLRDGQPVSEGESAAWARDVLVLAARDVGIDAEHRVERMLRDGRVNAFLRDARAIRNEEVRQRYYQLALTNPLVRGDALTTLIDAVDAYVATQTDREVVRQLQTAIAAASAR